MRAGLSWPAPACQVLATKLRLGSGGKLDRLALVWPQAAIVARLIALVQLSALMPIYDSQLTACHHVIPDVQQPA